MCPQSENIQPEDEAGVVLPGSELAGKLLGLRWEAVQSVRHLYWDQISNRTIMVQPHWNNLCVFPLHRYHHTGPVTAFYCLRESLAVLAQEVRRLDLWEQTDTEPAVQRHNH